MLQAVVDVNVLVSALLRPEGAPALVVRAWLAGAFELVASPQLLREFERVTTRPALVRRLDPAAVEALPATVRAEGLLADDPPPERVIAPDPDDDYLVALAWAVGVHVIVTGDGHLLETEELAPPALEPRALVELAAIRGALCS